MERANLEPITILATTWFPKGIIGRQRQGAFLTASRSWHRYLRYGGLVNLHVADDGSPQQPKVPPWIRGVVTHSVQQRKGVGASLNSGFLIGDNLILHAVDDWELISHYWLEPWAQLLLENKNIGAVRFGPPHPDLTGKVIMFERGWYLLLDRHHYAFSFRPTLFHKRFFEVYGPFVENKSALETERIMNEIFCKRSGPDIILALPDPWRHIYTIQLSNTVPGEEDLHALFEK